MINQYLIPTDQVMEDNIIVTVPKYILPFDTNWAGVFFEDKGVYLITVDITDKQHQDLIANLDVVDLSINNKKSRDSITKTLGITTKSTDNLIDSIVKLKDPNASALNLKISGKEAASINP